jgi:adenine deaminase
MKLASDDSVDQAILDIRAALGKAPADLVVRNVTLVNVYSEELHPADVAIRRHRIVAIRENFDGTARQELRGNGMFAFPGAVEPMDVDAGVAPDVLLKRGITSVITARDETYSDLSAWPLGTRVRALQPQALVGSATAALDALRQGTIPIVDAELCPDWGALFAEVAARGIDSSRFIIRQRTSRDDPIAAAVGAGQKPAKARQMVSANPAAHFALDHEIGGIAPGRQADIVLAGRPDGPPKVVIARGRIVFEA